MGVHGWGERKRERGPRRRGRREEWGEVREERRINE